VLLKYAADLADKKDLAIQLPTGSGKTLVGLMIAEWRRRKFSERVVYLCPTKQLVHQTVRQANTVYALEVKGFVGSNREFNQADVARYRSGECIAITTYSAVFNSNPFFDDAHLIVLDDAHTVENYIARSC
jgi:replicative superfamily II helicase